MGLRERIKALPLIPRGSITRADVMSVVSYDAETGRFTWKVTTRGHGKMIHPGDAAGWTRDGYRMLQLFGHTYRAHRVAWFLMSGAWPPEGREVDHENRDRGDNRWSNLRLATRSENNMNSKVRLDNTSGFKGVHRSRTGKWFARIAHNKRVIGLGTFRTREEAAAARAAAEKRLFGQFASS
ncbi:HNH endonuclease [Xanthomonas sp. NCPPB 1067]|uniref:HNH endonuclease signature motif containing protein n=1 Tax=Xanthomonas sp. NCPPB 1067 TaxID=487524 RepID=UPI001E323938|nr:HNH endonuclease signature motif containing protein [Xanthomonas sp. NCPPB 1067]MCC4588756.1 HNH endonuclease [Xanthomonas sp. NCPPB 1067]